MEQVHDNYIQITLTQHNIQTLTHPYLLPNFSQDSRNRTAQTQHTH